MARWLTLYYILSVFLLLVAASLFLYWQLDRSVAQENQTNLVHKVQVLTRLVTDRPINLAGIEQEVHEEAEVSAESQAPFFLRVLNSNGELVSETPKMNSLLPVSVFPLAAGREIQERRLQSATGSTFLLASSSAFVDAGSAGWRIQAAFDISASEGLLQRFRRNILMALAGGVLLATPIGIWIVRRGLRPVTEITRATESINAQQLHQRINAGHWPAELVSLAEAFDAMLDRLQESFERLRQFSADLAHELRTPINNLMGEAQVALSRVRTTADYTLVLQSSLEEHARLTRMIDSMLFLAQADQARAALSLRRLNVEAEMQAVIEFYQALADERGITLKWEGNGEVLADSLLLRRALSNLLSNAIKHTSRGGEITLAATQVEDRLQLSVQDTGTGIPTEHIGKLGDRFYRVDPSRGGGGDSSGLGLAIVKSIMSLHGGQLQIDSVLGKGTTASLVFLRAS